MTDHELLVAISGIMDKKLIPIENRLDTMQGEIRSMQGEIRTMQGEIRSIKSEINALKGEINGMKGEINALKGEISTMKGEILTIKGDILTIQDEIHDMKLFQENVILPRLNTIESCYTDTYERYKMYADKMESVIEDTALLKKVVSKHSEQLQKIS